MANRGLENLAAGFGMEPPASSAFSDLPKSGPSQVREGTDQSLAEATPSLGPRHDWVLRPSARSPPILLREGLVPLTGLEPVTPSLRMRCSTS